MTDERELPEDYLNDKPVQEVILILGGRSGKSTLASAIACYEAVTTNWKQYIRGGELAWIFVVATREKQAMDIGRNMIFQMLRQSPVLKTMIVKEPQKKLRSLFPYSKAGVLVLNNGAAITALPCSSKVGRGYPIGVAILDEAGWYARESKDEATDQGIYDSILPRQIQFGRDAKLIIISTPGDKTGLLWNKYLDKDKKKNLYYCFKIPTWLMRPDFPKEYFEKHRLLSPLGFSREYGAEFCDVLSPLFKNSEILSVCRDADNIIPPDKHFNYSMAIDAAFGDQDRFAVTICHTEINPKDQSDYKIIVDVCELIEEDIEKSLVEAAADRLIELYFKYNILEIYGDTYQSDAFQKILADRGVHLVAEPWTALKHRVRYGRLRSLVKQKRVEIPHNQELINELGGLQIKTLANSGQQTISHRVGGHDDMADSLSEAVFRASEDEIITPSGFQLL